MAGEAGRRRLIPLEKEKKKIQKVEGVGGSSKSQAEAQQRRRKKGRKEERKMAAASGCVLHE